MFHAKASIRSSMLWALVLLLACSERTPTRSPETASAPPPSAQGAASTTPPALGAVAPSASSAPLPSPSPSASVFSDAGTTSTVSVEAPLVDGEGKPLPQTDERPRVDSPAFVERMKRLVTAIRTDDPEAARDAFFPVVAYEQVKDIAHPARDWERRLYAAFQRNVHEYHRSFGERAGSLELVGVDVPEATSRWMKPGSEGNRVGYHRVLRSRLRVKDGTGRERALEITSMISWRGEWYVVHLHGFK